MKAEFTVVVTGYSRQLMFYVTPCHGCPFSCTLLLE